MLLPGVLALLLAVVAAGGQPAPQRPVVLANVTVLDGTGAPARRDATVIIRDGRIESVGKSGAAVPKEAEVFDGRGKYVIPGLWDMHIHLSWSKANALPVLVANGVTSVRDLGGRLGEIDEWRTQIAAGLIVGPRILRAGPMLNGKQFNPLQMVPGNPEETRGVVRALKQVDVDFLKTHRRLPRESYFALIDEAKKVGLSVVGHIPMTVTPEEASDAGQVTIEHTETLFEGTFSAPLKEGELVGAVRRFREGDAAKLFARFVRNGTVVDPTLVAYRSVIESVDPSVPPDPRKRYVALSFRQAAEKDAKPTPPAEIAEAKAMFAELKEVVRVLHRSGVKLVTGTDLAAARVPGFPIHDELALLVEAGLTPAEALEAATRTPARVLNRASDLGTLEAGKLADLVVLDANPLDDISNTQKISAVVLGGKLLRRTDLDALLAEGEELAARN